jgi:hypothetical protein
MLIIYGGGGGAASPFDAKRKRKYPALEKAGKFEKSLALLERAS